MTAKTRRKKRRPKPLPEGWGHGLTIGSFELWLNSPESCGHFSVLAVKGEDSFQIVEAQPDDI